MTYVYIINIVYNHVDLKTCQFSWLNIKIQTHVEIIINYIPK